MVLEGVSADWGIGRRMKAAMAQGGTCGDLERRGGGGSCGRDMRSKGTRAVRAGPAVTAARAGAVISGPAVTPQGHGFPL
jgi:hypothetical protein